MTNERKRGEKLEITILEAADEIIHTFGYEHMTFQNVAKKAKTSRTVIYRRYETKGDLLHALIRYKAKQALGGSMIELINERGSLRADLLAVVELYQQFFEAIGPKVISAILFELSQKNSHLQLWFNRALESNMKIMRKIQDFAKKRGEINHEFSLMQMSLPFDLLRFENVIRGGNVSKEYLTQLVDEILMPIYHSPSKHFFLNREKEHDPVNKE
ncbi:TetR/AcrR family transcriptional regulator [Anoxybacillus sp. UARK-01]|uniref:TetR/AcrR family transcriptional regulator n=1 Tax=Anoxybacillus sp. UARK-01 TaxID=1895648 RepID=UPI0013747D6F|nr:TetR/AcrR family transcriptional regulator [Anoxybacillus sp. UARK-01]